MDQILKQRNPVYDIVKGIGIILVVFGHTLKGNNAGDFIYSFHMPLFFIISGILYNEASKDKYVVKQIKHILIPYFIFAVLTYLYWRFFEVKFRKVSTGIDFESQFVNILFPMNGDYLFNTVLWFLPCLFICMLLLHVIPYKKTKYISSLYLILSVSFVTIFDYRFPNIEVPFWGNTVMHALPFVLLGYLIKPYVSNKIGTIINTALAIALLCGIYLIKCQNDMRSNVYGYGYICYFLIAIVATACIYIISSKLINVKWLKYIGMNSLIIMLIHEPIKRIIIAVYSMILKQDVVLIRSSIFHSIVITSIVIVFTLPFIILINKKLKFLIGQF